METNNQSNQENERTENDKDYAVYKPSEGKKTKDFNLTIKGLIIFILILLLLIPLQFIFSLVSERSERQNEVISEVSSKWANSQTLSGPILVIPYKKEPLKNEKGEIIGYSTGKLYFLPEVLNIKGEVLPQFRHRSIYNVTVYQAGLTFEGHFNPIDLNALDILPEHILLDKAELFFGLNDFRGIEEQLIIKWDSLENELTASDLTNGLQTNGLSAHIQLSPEDLSKTHAFSIYINIKGSDDLLFTPIGKTNITKVTSPWTNPSSTGNFIPNNPATLTDKGFDAEWKILYLNRNYPQVWVDKTYDLSESVYGVRLLQSTDSYSKTDRSVKYAILFIALTFALYFFIEILQNKRVHPLQYTLVGMALCVFYTLLLSISEYLEFNLAYLIASVATVSLITLYTKSAFGKWKIASIFGAVLTGLYGFIFILIQLQDRALLFGSIGLFVLLAVSMYYSRKINWYRKE